ncbi:EAL domain-containing protein [Pseudomonas edaphica]|uniref:EAL domain-containing protein n=1 Tax=Pseudomonas edaphica TaxID=2006980 RepID=A0ABY2U2N8_9PSED|nr:EAL domain-containing response regulator [Pseudomonas edaphica]TLG90477.1 EAL domain-containing protein [Pseudomonas edaphica]
MKPDCVLIIESHVFQRGVLVKALQRLGVRSILVADDTAQALAHMQDGTSIDIVFFDLADGALNMVEFWQLSLTLKSVRATVLYSDLQPDVYRAVAHMSSLSGIKLLGVLDKPLQLGRLEKLLNFFVQTQNILPAHKSMTPDLLSREEVLRGLEKAEFRAWYQPKFNLRDGTLFGAEVLVRWNHPTQGLLLPKDLLAAVLGHGLINEVFEQLLDQGVELLFKLKSRGISLQLAFNLAASQLSSDELFTHVDSVLKRRGLPGTASKFEVTERGLLDLPLPVLNNLNALHRLGCGLSIDDFGMGFSSLRLLAQLPFSQLKLDGVFVQDLSDARSRAVVTSSLALSEALGMDLVIEGVATRCINDTLVNLGCSFGQGFHLAMPMKDQDFFNWMERFQP